MIRETSRGQEFARRDRTLGVRNIRRRKEKRSVADGRAENHGDFSRARLKAEPSPGAKRCSTPSVNEWGWFCARIEFVPRGMR